MADVGGEIEGSYKSYQRLGSVIIPNVQDSHERVDVLKPREVSTLGQRGSTGRMGLRPETDRPGSH